MTRPLTLLITSTALTAMIAIPAWSAMRASAQGGAVLPLRSLAVQQAQSPLLVLVDDDEDEAGEYGDEGEDGGQGRISGNHDDDEACDDDEGSCGGGSSAAAAGTVAPPQNGLFSNGALPKVQVK